jgi:hypothetical protein
VAKVIDKIADRAKPLLDKVDDIGEKVAAKLSKGCGCFTENTPVLVAKGQKAIKNVKVGDKVWAYNAKTKKFALQTVTKVFTVVTDSLFTVYVAGQSIETTPEHPFLVHNHWVNARDLKAGNLLTLYKNKHLGIDSIKLNQQRTLTYNFTVANYHTYTVSKAGVVVHNSGGCDLVHGNSKLSGKTQHGYVIKEKKSGEVLEYGISGQPINKNGTSPRVAQKINKI